jgi:excisionase family DNA binding protein
LPVGWFDDTKVVPGVLRVAAVLVRLRCGFDRVSLGFFEERASMAGAVEQMLREVMDIRQASEYLGISGDTLYRYASEGFIPAFKLGNRWRFKRSLLDSWMVRMSGAKAPSNVSVMPRQKKPVSRAR